MISRLKLKNWRSHLESEFKFAKGVNALIGIMGSGKSSVMDGICYALFGSFPSLQQRKLKLNDLIRSKPNQAKDAAVEVDFIKDGAVYTVCRDIAFDRGTTDVELRKNGELVDAENSEAVTEYIEKLLGIDYNSFVRTVYAEQNRFDYFLELARGQRMAQIDALLKLDRFETARKNSTTVINKIESELVEKESAAKSFFTEKDAQDFEKLNTELSKLAEKISELNKKLAVIKNEREKISKEIAAAKEAAKIRVEIERIGTERAGFLATIEVIESELSTISKTIAGTEQKKANPAKDALEKLLKECGTEGEILDKIKKLKESELEFSKKIERCETKIEYLGHALCDIDEGENCPLCKTKLKGDQKETIKEKHSDEINSLKCSASALKEKLTNAKNACAELEIILEKVEAAKKNIEASEYEISLRQRLANEKKAQISELEAKKSGIKEKLSNCDKKRADLLKKAESIGIVDLENLERKYEQLISDGQTILGDIMREQALGKEREERWLILQNKKEIKEKILKEVEWLSQAKFLLSVFSNALMKTQEELRGEFIKIVNEVMAEVWPTLYPYGDITTVKLKIEDRDYVLKARTTTDWVNVEGIASGGERSLAVLALRIAFSLALARNFGMLILDEPTHNLDENAVDELAITLRERLPSLIEQVFLITHEEKLEGAVSAYLYKLERNKELDEPTRVNLIASPEI